jgi:hypothetical protein
MWNSGEATTDFLRTSSMSKEGKKEGGEGREEENERGARAKKGEEDDFAAGGRRMETPQRQG